MTDLDKLIEAVGEGRIAGGLIMGALDAINDQLHCLAAFDGSIDAAHRLHDALMTDRVTGMSLEIYGDTTYAAIFWGENDETVRGLTEGGNPARAWLLAILRALKAKGDHNGTV